MVIVPVDTQRKFAVGFRFGQPFDYEELLRLGGIAAFNIYTMLDPIADDCLYLNNVELNTLWGAVFRPFRRRHLH